MSAPLTFAPPLKSHRSERRSRLVRKIATGTFWCAFALALGAVACVSVAMP